MARFYRAASSKTKILLLALTAAFALPAPWPAQAAVTVGEGITPTDACNSGPAVYTYLQTSSVSDSYVVPTAGVLTSWSHTAAGDPVEQIRLKVARPVAGESYTVIGEDEYRAPLANTVNTYPLRVPVKAGDLIGFAFTGGGLCMEAPVIGYGARFVKGDPTIGTESTFGSEATLRLAISARLEADADGDGFGDETQDRCPRDPSASGICPLSPSPPTADTDPPETTITKGAPNKAGKPTVKFRFRSDEVGSRFECKVDRKPWKTCSSPKKVKQLRAGRHRFRVRAIDAGGNVDPSPAQDRFQIVGRPRT